MQDFKMDLYKDEIYVFTPTGELIKLAKGATVLDFAFAIHTKLGCKCVSAKVNEKNVPIKYTLNNGDTVSIVTAPTQTPKRDWLNIVVTSKARVKIKQALREETAKAVDFAKENVPATPLQEPEDRDGGNRSSMRYIKKKGFKNVTDFYVEIAEERLDPNQVIDEYLEQLRRETETNDHTEVRSAEEYITTTEVEEISTNKDVLVIDKNLTGIEYKLAKCCNPIYGDEVFGSSPRKASRSTGWTARTHRKCSAVSVTASSRPNGAVRGTTDISSRSGSSAVTTSRLSPTSLPSSARKRASRSAP